MNMLTTILMAAKALHTEFGRAGHEMPDVTIALDDKQWRSLMYDDQNYSVEYTPSGGIKFAGVTIIRAPRKLG